MEFVKGYKNNCGGKDTEELIIFEMNFPYKKLSQSLKRGLIFRSL